jgi:hypothetical protein
MLRPPLLIGILCALPYAAVVNAKECKGVTFADQVSGEGGTLTLNGLGLRQATIFKVNVYVGALYVTKPSADPMALVASNSPYELVLQFVRNVDSGDIKKGWMEGFEHNVAANDLPALKDRIATLGNWMEDIKIGQQLSFAFRPGIGVTVSVNGKSKGSIKGDDFGRALLSIWLGANPPNPEVKSGMLGGSCG